MAINEVVTQINGYRFTSRELEYAIGELMNHTNKCDKCAKEFMGILLHTLAESVYKTDMEKSA